MGRQRGPAVNFYRRFGYQRADSRFADALAVNQRADNHTILIMLIALVVFFAAASTRLGRPRVQWISCSESRSPFLS